MRVALVVAAVGVSLGETAGAFVVDHVRIAPGASIEPSAGSLNVDHQWLGPERLLVRGDPIPWQLDRDLVEANTFLALDERGGASDYSVTAFPKVGTPFPIPRWTDPTGLDFGSGVPGVDSGILADGSGILGGATGASWGPDPTVPPREARSLESLVNGRTIDSMFIGTLSLTDPGATLIGDDLVALIDPDDDGPMGLWDVPLGLDGGAGPFGLRLELERDRLYAGHVEMFIVVPAGGPLAAALVVAAGAGRRRRRDRG
jgi:hypothetical protein